MVTRRGDSHDPNLSGLVDFGARCDGVLLTVVLDLGHCRHATLHFRSSRGGVDCQDGDATQMHVRDSSKVGFQLPHSPKCTTPHLIYQNMAPFHNLPDQFAAKHIHDQVP
eukprot:1930304-Amphidinium_carterae.1